MNRLSYLFPQNKKIFSIFVTAGFPNLTDTAKICETLAVSGVDFN
jgi:tryptophan synthase alpha chain